MPVRFFGQYLLANRIVTREQLLEAVTYQTKHNLRLGKHALKLGMISQTNLDRIHQLQHLKDFKFGEAAVVLQILTPKQVDELLDVQRREHLYLGDTIVRLGYADQARINAALDAYCIEQAQYVQPQVNLREFPGVDGACHNVCVDLTAKMLLRIWGIPSKVGSAAPALAGSPPIPLSGHVARIEFTGDFRCSYVIGVPNDVAAVGARTVLATHQIDSIACGDMVREFANVVCGNTCASLAQMDRRADISPPESVDELSVVATKGAMRVGIFTPYGEVTVVLLPSAATA